MKKWKRKILIAVLAIFVGLPLTLVVGGSVYGYLMDKTNGSIVSSGITRSYLLYVPKSYDRSKPTPLVISIHPAATWPAFERDISHWNDLADERGFIVVYPAGMSVFHLGTIPGPHVWHGGRSLPGDVKFVSELIDRLQAEYNIDASRIYANGMSNGGAMAFALGCELHGRIAAVGVVAPADPPTPGQDRGGDSTPMPTVAFHGTADTIAPYNGGKSPVSPGRFPKIPEWIAAVAKMNQCKPEPVETRVSATVRRLAYENSASNAEAILYIIDGGGHTWPGGEHLPEWIAGRTSDEINATLITWEFFARHRREPK
jgi:polyhydroxybutyrate depolymerase